MHFKLAATFAVSTNAKLKFIRMDGGVQRRGVGCTFPFVFGESAEPGTNQRTQSSWNLKDEKLVGTQILGLYVFMETVFRVFYREGYHKLPGRMPKDIETATKELNLEEAYAVMQEICEEVFRSHQ